MIKDPLIILTIIFVIEVFLLLLPRLSWAKRLLDIVPIIVFFFLSGMLLTNLGLLSQKEAIYQQSIDFLLPMALFFMLIGVDIRRIWHLGPMALIMFFGGMIGVMLGMIAGFLVVKGILGSSFALGFGALTGSWTGGSANMIAVKEALQVPDAVFTLMLILDSTIPYVWMGVLIYLSNHQKAIDAFHQAHSYHRHENEEINTICHWPTVVMVTVVGIVFSLGLNNVVNYLPKVEGLMTAFTWKIVIVTILSLSIGVTDLGKRIGKALGSWGQWVLFFVLICIGTKGDLSQWATAPWLFLAGFIALVVHGLCIYLIGRWVKAPLFLMAVASQANLGGVASASMLAELYKPGLASVGLLMAILGNITGTYAGIVVGHICRLLAN